MFLGPPSNDANEEMLCGYIRAYIMHMIASILFISMIENAVQVLYIPVLEKFNDILEYN